MTKSQRESQARAQAKLKEMLESGEVTVVGLEEKGDKKKVVYGKKKPTKSGKAADEKYIVKPTEEISAVAPDPELPVEKSEEVLESWEDLLASSEEEIKSEESGNGNWDDGSGKESEVVIKAKGNPNGTNKNTVSAVNEDEVDEGDKDQDGDDDVEDDEENDEDNDDDDDDESDSDEEQSTAKKEALKRKMEATVRRQVRFLPSLIFRR